MDRHNVNEHGNGDLYLMRGAETNQLTAGPNFERGENMYSEGVPEFVFDQGVYYPTATNYGYYCTGFGTPTEWEDQNRVFGIDGPEVQYTGIQSDSLPFVYYSPTYGYAEFPHNPYNPYIPGAAIGVDSPFPGAQQYYSLSPYHSSVSSPAYFPIIVPPDSNSPETLSSQSTANVNRSNGRTHRTSYDSTSGPFSRYSSKGSSNTTNSLNRSSEIPRDNVSRGKLSVSHGSIISAGAGNISGMHSSRAQQGRNASSSNSHVDINFSGKVPSYRSQSQYKVGFSDFGGRAHTWGTTEQTQTRVPIGSGREAVGGSLEFQAEQNRGPRISGHKDQLAVKSYTTKAGGSNARGVIVIDVDQYNKDSFPIDYEDAKFFVIKSYSEDDVHKSIKYNVWSSTPHGNTKLQSAHEDAQKIAAGKPNGCPVFLFFSVNASGQFCGVAEMIGPVDVFKDMDFWQQDKWSGSFPVKWHMIKDVQNASFRHIILENNENKPVTNSRDTQEIPYKQGLDMLKLFRNHSSRTSLFDDFMYYENRQKMMQEERARLRVRSFHAPFNVRVPTLNPPHRLMNIVGPPTSDGKINEQKDANSSGNIAVLERGQVASNSDVGGAGTRIPSRPDQRKNLENMDKEVSSLKIGSLVIRTKQYEPATAVLASAIADASQSVTMHTEVVTVGSMPVKVNGFSEYSSHLTVGTLSLDTGAFQGEKEGGLTQVAVRK